MIVGRKKTHSSKVKRCPRLHGHPDKQQQEVHRKRQRQRGGTITSMAVMAVAHVAGGVEPMEVDPPEGEEEPMEVDPSSG